MIRIVVRILGCTVATFAVLLLASPAQAQFRPQPLNDPATGEQFHIEAGVAWWRPTADITLASEAINIPGTNIDFKNDLGLQDQSVPALQLTLRPAVSHKFRLQFIPLSYSNSATLPRTIVFNGQRYPAGMSVDSTFDWKAYRFGYEYDFITTNRGFGGFIVDLKYTQVRTEFPPAPGEPSIEFAEARAPIPALGGIARVYVVPNISITGEVTGIKIPNVSNRYQAHYVDADIYGTVNFNRYVGAQIGYRVLDLGYVLKTDSGSFTEKGIYFGVIARY